MGREDLLVSGDRRRRSGRRDPGAAQCPRSRHVSSFLHCRRDLCVIGRCPGHIVSCRSLLMNLLLVAGEGDRSIVTLSDLTSSC